MSLQTYWLALKEGKTVNFRPRGNSMKGLINDGAMVEVTPCDTATLEVKDIVLVRVKGNYYLHKIVSIEGEKFLIGNNKGRLNGWVKKEAIGGLCVMVDSNPRPRIEGKTSSSRD